jgi:hypothetical protein
MRLIAFIAAALIASSPVAAQGNGSAARDQRTNRGDL